MQMIVAVDHNWAIGYQNKLLVKIPADMRFFRDTTKGKVVICGKKTLDSFPGGAPLKDRRNIIITRNHELLVPDGEVVHSIKEALDVAADCNTNDIYVIGGASIYEQMISYCDTIHVTKINYNYTADTYFPNLDQLNEWELVEESEEQTYYDLEYTFQKYKKKA